jgi:3-oxoacyl-[acyl-carrier-protein] synthase-3
MRIISTGICLPHEVVKNSEITEHGKWVEENLGIKERRMSERDAWQLGFIAALRAIREAYMNPRMIDCIIVATATPAKKAPSTAALIQRSIEAYNAVCFDINAVCSGFVYAMDLADSLHKKYHNILIIGVDTFSHITDFKDRNCVFFGNGAGAVLVRPSIDLFVSKLGTDSRGWEGFSCENHGTFEMDGKAVLGAGTKYLPRVINQVLVKAGVFIEEVDYLLPHQASLGMLKKLADTIGLPFDHVLTNMDRYGNTAAASIPILLHENKFKPGDKLLIAAIGSGWTYGAILMEWS